MFKTLGALVAIYTVYAAFQGEVYAKKGHTGTIIRKTDQPAYFWTVIGIYLALSLALVFVF